MPLKIKQPLAPMEAQSVAEIPAGPEWQYEPKWDGFRCLAFRDGDKVELQSKSGQSLTRYFPEIVEGLGSLKAPRFVLDGERQAVRVGGARDAPRNGNHSSPNSSWRSPTTTSVANAF